MYRPLGRSQLSRLEIDLLRCHVLGITRSRLLAWPHQSFSTQQLTELQLLLSRREQGEPLAYLIGRKAFWSFEVQVTSATLIPRPETELLVEQALARLPVDVPNQVVDLGTGSGAIALALALERPYCQLFATDVDYEVLAVAQANAERLNVGRIAFLQGDWFTALKNKYRVNLIVSNPPYLAEGNSHLQGDGVRYEPRQALVSGTDGLEAIRYLIASASKYLVNQGWLLLEHGYDQGESVAQLFKQYGYQAVKTYRDLAGQARVTGGQVFNV